MLLRWSPALAQRTAGTSAAPVAAEPARRSAPAVAHARPRPSCRCSAPPATPPWRAPSRASRRSRSSAAGRTAAAAPAAAAMRTTTRTSSTRAGRGPAALRRRAPYRLTQRFCQVVGHSAATSCSWKPPPRSAIPASPFSPTACSSTGSRSTTRRRSSSCAPALEAGDDPARVVGDAIEIGARVLHREQTGANVEFVKAEFEKTARELQTRVRRALPHGRRAARPEVRRGVRARHRAREPRALAALRRRVLRRGAEPRQGDARRGSVADPRGPAQAVHRRLRRQPAGRSTSAPRWRWSSRAPTSTTSGCRR